MEIWLMYQIIQKVEEGKKEVCYKTCCEFVGNENTKCQNMRDAAKAVP